MEPIIAQVGELPDRVTQYAECDGHRVTVASRGDAGMKLARVLVAKGYDPTRPYETRRGERTALRYSTLAHAASLTVEETQNGPRIRKWKPFDREDLPE